MNEKKQGKKIRDNIVRDLVKSFKEKELLKIGNRSFLNTFCYPASHLDRLPLAVRRYTRMALERDWLDATGRTVQEPFSFLIFKIGNMHYAKSGISGRINDPVPGGTDASTVIQSALNALPPEGGMVFIKSGDYLINRTINITKSNVTIFGEGGGTNLRATFPSGDLLLVGAPPATVSRIEIAHLRFGTTVTRTAGSYLRFDTCFQVFVHDFWMENACDAIYSISTTEDHYARADIRNTKRDGITIEGGWDHFISEMVMDNPDIANIGTGIHWLEGETLAVHDTDVIRFSTGLLVAPKAGKMTRWGYFTNLILDTCSDNGMRLVADGGEIAGLFFTGCWTSSNTNYGVLMDMTPAGGLLRGVSLVNHISLRNGLAGIRIANPTLEDILIADSWVISNSQTTPGTRHGIEVVGGVHKFGIVGTVCKNGWAQGATQSFGILLDPGDTGDFIISDCDVGENLNGTLVNYATGANQKISNVLGYVNENSGTATFSGDGTTTTFNIPHGLVLAPTHVNLEAKSSGAVGDKYWSADATNITVTFITAPPTGTNNIVIGWKGEV